MYLFILVEQIAQNVREELRRLKRRKGLQSGERSMECEGGYDSPGSPPSPQSPSGASSSLTVQHHSQSSKDKPLFTLKQVSCFY